MSNSVEKVKWVAGIGLVFALIVMTNLSDVSNFRRVKASLRTVYEDRVVAYDILFDVRGLVRDEQLALRAPTGPDTAGRAEFREQIGTELTEFAATRLTREEAVVFGQLREAVAALPTRFDGSADDLEGYAADLAAIDVALAQLAEIQLRESRSELNEGKRISRNYELFTRLEIVVLVVLGLGIIAIILYAPSGRDPDAS